ncbi:MAG: LptF/LptG family permease [Candidatus Lightella neohaematopini]|nr:LptF/LptG family permease [Candidatus Lightella neohaematopini]
MILNSINKYIKLLFGILNLYIIRIIFIYAIQISFIISFLSCINKLIELLHKLYNYSITYIILIIFFNLVKDIELFLPIIISLSVLFSIIYLKIKNEFIVILTLKKKYYNFVTLLVKTSITVSILFLIILEVILSFNYLLFNFNTKKNITNYNIYITNNKKLILIGNIYNNKIYNINIFCIVKNKLSIIYYAKMAKFIKNYWVLYQVRYLRLTKPVLYYYVSTYIWHTDLTPYELYILTVAPELLSIKQLYHQINYFKKNNIDYYYYQLYMWNKLLLPINITIIILIITSLSFRKINISSTKNIINGIIVNVLFYIIHQFTLYISFIAHKTLPLIILTHLIVLIYCIKINKNII